MKDISDAADLITAARDTLLNGLLPTLNKDQRYAGLMIANAMAIALREHRSGVDAARDEIARLRMLLAGIGLDDGQSGDAGVENALPLLRRELSAAIRRGGFDNASRAAALMDHLVRTAADWLAISNPKALRAEHAAA
jgi:hypothetical protein